MTETPILVTTEELDDHLDSGEVRVVDLSKLEHYVSSHIPGATHLDYVTLLDGNKPAPGRLPPGKQLEQLSSVLGLSNGGRIIACDDEGSGRAARLVWTLHVMGYPSCSVLDGGMTAWRNEQRRLSVEQPVRENTAPTVTMDTSVIATREYILSQLNDDHVILVDARTPEEYIGTKKLDRFYQHVKLLPTARHTIGPLIPGCCLNPWATRPCVAIPARGQSGGITLKRRSRPYLRQIHDHNSASRY